MIKCDRKKLFLQQLFPDGDRHEVKTFMFIDLMDLSDDKNQEVSMDHQVGVAGA